MLNRRQVFRHGAALGLALPGMGALRSKHTAAQTANLPPEAATDPQIFALPGGLWIDPYSWLENGDDPEVIAYLDAENAYADTVLAPTAALQEALYTELTGRIQQTDTSLPIPWNGYLYYTRTEEGTDYFIICRKKGNLEAPEEILLDVNAIAGDYLSLQMWLPSPDNRLLAYNLDETGDEFYTLHVLDMETGQVIDQLPDVWDFQWANDSQTLFYTKQHPDRVWPYAHYRHVVGEDAETDTLLFEEPIAAFELYTSIATDRSYIFLYSESVDTNEVLFVPADEPTAEPKLFIPRRAGVRDFLDHHGDDFIVQTDENAPNYKLMAVPVADTDPANWRELIPHRDDVVLVYFQAFARHLAIFGREQGFSQAWVRDIASGETTPIAFDEEVYVVYLGTNWEFDTDTIRIGYSSPVTPDTDLSYDLITGERTVLKQLEVLGGHDPSRYRTERLFATAPDGTRIPISLVSLREAPAGLEDGPRPLRLDGYGSYGTIEDPWFSILRLTLIDRGITFAQAHVRGGGELGRRWWEEGRLLHKWNTFTDFIACAEHLIANGYTAPDRLLARGASAGGLLAGVVATQRPDLFRAIVADVPAVDPIAELLRSTNGPYHFPELGDPYDPVAFDYIRSYSPYETVRAQQYPAMFVTAGLEDRRVPYWSPAKWVAKMRHIASDEGLLLLRTDMGSGHFGASGFQDSNQQTAELYAFMLMALGLEDAEPAVQAARAPKAARRADTPALQRSAPVASSLAARPVGRGSSRAAPRVRDRT
jgi:oligopeptidase B